MTHLPKRKRPWRRYASTTIGIGLERRVASNDPSSSIQATPQRTSATRVYLMAMGRTNESLAQMTRARELDPLSISMNFSLGWRLYMARKNDQAIEQLQNTLEMDPNFALPRMVLGQAYEEKNAYPQALSELQKAVGHFARQSFKCSGLWGTLMALPATGPSARESFGSN